MVTKISKIGSMDRLIYTIEGEAYSVIYFWRDGCLDCTRTTPQFKKLSDSTPTDAIRYYTMDQSDLSHQDWRDRWVKRVPQVHIYKDGEPVGKLTGYDEIKALAGKLDKARRRRKGDAGDSSEYNDSGDSDAWDDADSGDSSEYNDAEDSDAWDDSDSYGEYKREEKRTIDDRYYRRGRRGMKGKTVKIHNDDDNFSDYDSPSDSDGYGGRVMDKAKKAQRHHGST